MSNIDLPEDIGVDPYVSLVEVTGSLPNRYPTW